MPDNPIPVHHPRPVPIRKEGAAQSQLFDRGTGTDGPAPRRQVRPLPGPAVPYGKMLRHIIRTVKAVTKDEDFMLGDGPTQDLISTIYIDAAKRCRILYDFTEER